jgi:hypothetical protein
VDPLRKFIAGICAVLFIFSAIFALFAVNIELQAFNSAPYKRAFENLDLYVRIPQILAQALEATVSSNATAQPYLKAMTVQDWQNTIITLLPPNEIKLTADNALDSTFNYINDKSNSASISLILIKSHLLGPSGVEVIKQILQAQPACTADQLLQMGLGILGGSIALCNPPPQLIDVANPLIHSQLQVITNTLPNEIMLITAPSDPSADPRVQLKWVRTFMKTTPVFPLIMLFILTLFIGQTLHGWLKWWGYPFLIIGALCAAIAYFGAPTLSFIAQRLLLAQGPKFVPPIFFSVASDTLGAVVNEILKPVLIEGLILTSVGLIMIITAFFVARHNKQVHYMRV